MAQRFRLCVAIALLLLLIDGRIQGQQTIPSEDEQRELAQKLECRAVVAAGKCRWVHGRLSWWQGTPSYRLWQVGTHHLYGITTAANSEQIDPLDNEHPHFPFGFEPTEERLWGDFFICPLEPFRSGSMQSACISRARNLFRESIDLP